MYVNVMSPWIILSSGGFIVRFFDGQIICRIRLTIFPAAVSITFPRGIVQPRYYLLLRSAASFLLPCGIALAFIPNCPGNRNIPFQPSYDDGTFILSSVVCLKPFLIQILDSDLVNKTISGKDSVKKSSKINLIFVSIITVTLYCIGPWNVKLERVVLNWISKNMHTPTAPLSFSLKVLTLIYRFGSAKNLDCVRESHFFVATPLNNLYSDEVMRKKCQGLFCLWTRNLHFPPWWLNRNNVQHCCVNESVHICNILLTEITKNSKIRVGFAVAARLTGFLCLEMMDF